MAILTGRGPTLRPRTLVFVGLLALIAGVWTMSDHAGFLSRVATVEAEVVSVETFDRGEMFSLYRATLRFVTDAGQTVTATALESYRPTTAGERLTIGYDTENPTDARLMDLRDRWLTPVWLVLFAVVTLAVGVRRALVASQDENAGR
ncbi:MAG: DUF3592 domain-containing protein [Alphaproteobacteria bacterium]|nr:DUF3592 domain-containing protein [Alphaproteobacteria bacterium]